MNRKLRMGMIGGGQGAFIGAVHRMAAALDGQIELVCGAFSSDPERSKASGKELYLQEDRVYDNYEEMISKEKLLGENERMDFVSIVTPNYMHFAPAKLALENGFHVMCDKPMTLTVEEAKELVDIVQQTGLVFGLTHNYTGYPMVKQAKAMISASDLGAIRKVVVEYPQGWLATPLEETGQKQAEWRVDPSRSGLGGALGDIGTHAANLAEYVIGENVSEVCAEVNTFVSGRLLDDDANVLIRFEKGTKGVLHCSQISVGEENGLKIYVYGEKGGLEWRQQEPNNLIYRPINEEMSVLRPGVGTLYPEANEHIRLPAGHPEGFIEAFANLYRNFSKAVTAHHQGVSANPIYDFPSVHDGMRGMRFVKKVVESGQSDQKWIKIKD